METAYRRRSRRQNEEETEPSKLPKYQSYPVAEFQNIFPTCEDGEYFDCEENKSNQSLDENCKGILNGDLMFTNDSLTNETSSCTCRGSKRRKRNSENILKQGWSKYIR